MQSLERHLAIPLRRAAHESAAIALTGPRGSGKRTLARREFPRHTYIDLADAAERLRARADPAAFLGRVRGPATIDNAHRAPGLLAQDPSHSVIFLAPMRLDAGVPELHLLPPSVAELEGWPSLPFETLGRYLPPKLVHPRTTLGEMLEGRRPNERELEEDVGYLIRVHDRDRFHVFVRELAGRNGQVIDQRELAGECGVTHTTIARWLDALERLFVIVQACPAEEDFGKRLVRRRKVFFLDPGYIGETGRFESFVAAALLKRLWHRGEEARLSHWLTSTGSEVALVAGGHGFAVPVTGALTALEKWKRLSPRHAGSLITAGAEARRTGDVFVYPWFVL